MSDYEELMQELPGGDNSGRASGIGVQPQSSRKPTEFLSARDMQVEELMRQGGWVIDWLGYGGTTAHRGPLQPGEYVDPVIVQEAVERRLGFTYAEISAVYPDKPGTLSATQRAMRSAIDQRLLAVSHSGGNMLQLAKILGWPTLLGEGGQEKSRKMERALARAKAQALTPQIPHPVVLSSHVCFVCESKNAKPRRRRHVSCPQHLLPLPPYRDGTVNLCDPCFVNGFEHEPGNPAYWAFRNRSR